MLTWCRATLEALLAMGHLFPHLMFVGPHEHELYSTLKDFLAKSGRAVSDGDVLVHECETNGGISAVRDVLRPFTRSPRHPRPALVILRRFDRLSPDAQFALRRTMEIDQDKCRCLAVSTTTSSIIQPLHSRFVIVNCPGESATLFRVKRMQGTAADRLCARGVEGLAETGLREARQYAREGVAVCDVLVWLERLACDGAIPWRLLVAAAVMAEEVHDEALGIYLIGVTCSDWVHGRSYTTYASPSISLPA